jgi:hypothetical protein
MNWSNVGGWIKNNAGTGATLVGSLLTGNIPSAVAAGVSLVSGATGTNDPSKALAELQGNPDAMVKLKELYYKNEDSVRQHIEEITRLELDDKQKEQKETQLTIRSGDNAEDVIVRRTRPLQSWLSLVGALIYVFYNQFQSTVIDVTVLGLLLTLPWTYAGLRQVGKGIDSFKANKSINKQ